VLIPASSIPRGHALCALSLGLAASGALAQHRDDGYWLHVAGYRPTIESSARSDLLVGSRPGSTVSFEDELGLASRKTLPWFTAGARLGSDWRVEVEYFSLRRNGTQSISRDIAFGQTVFPASATLNSSFDSDIFRLSAGWSALRTEQTELGMTLGLHITRFKLGLAAQAAVGGASASGRAEAQDALVPLPTVGLYGKHDFTREWSVQARIDYFTLSFGDYGGGLMNLMAAVGYRFSDRAGVSIG
jgi:hypothetical protein